MVLFFTRGKATLSLLLCFSLFLFLSEPFIIPYIVEKAPLGGYLAKIALNRSASIGDSGDFILIHGLLSTSPQVVRESCFIAQEQKSIQAVPLLFKLVNISDPETSAASLAALQSILNKDSLARDLSPQGKKDIITLIRSARSDSMSGRRAADRLTEYGIVAVSPICDLLETMVDDPRHNGEVVPLLNALGNIGAGYRPELIIALLQKPAPASFRKSAENALSRLGQGALPFLDKELKSKDYWRFASAAEVLFTIDKELAVHYLSQLLNSGYQYSESMRTKCYDLFGRAGMVEAKEALRRAVEFEASKAMQIHAIEALGKIKHESVVPILLKVLSHDPDYEVRKAASKALYINGTPRAHMALTESYLSNPIDAPGHKAIGDLFTGNRSDSGEVND